jgi:leucyl/phenylalanyl-tRNA--protein transferase
VALAHLVARLRLGGFKLLDTQFVTTHLAQFGALEIRRDEYKVLLADALPAPATWPDRVPPEALRAEFQAMAGREVACAGGDAA